MKNNVYLLSEVIGAKPNCWKQYWNGCRTTFVCIAGTEEEARGIAQSNAGLESSVVSDVWLNPKYTSCIKQDLSTPSLVSFIDLTE